MNPSIMIAQNCQALAGRLQPPTSLPGPADSGPLSDLGAANTRLFRAAHGAADTLESILARIDL